MDGITFRSNPRYPDDDIVTRVTEIVLGARYCERTYEVSPNRWDLGAMNDWWLSKKPMSEFKLEYRYGGGGNAELMRCLRATIIWRIGLENFNREAE